MNDSNIPKHLIDGLEQRWNVRRLREDIILENDLKAKLGCQNAKVVADHVFNVIWDELLGPDKLSLGHQY